MNNDWIKNQTPELPILEDKHGNDALERNILVNSLCNIAQLAQTPCTIALNGEWGSGKTFILDLLKRRLEEDHYPVIWFDLWEHEGVGNPLFALSKKVLDLAGIKKREKLYRDLTNGAMLLGSVTITAGSALAQMPWLAAIGNIAFSVMKKELSQSYEKAISFKDDFKRAIEHLLYAHSKAHPIENPRLFILVDDIDRCFPDQISILMSSIKHYLNVSNCVFIIALDKNRTLAALSKTKGIETDAPWLDKLFTFEMNVPMTTQNSRIGFLNLAFGRHFSNLDVLSWVQNMVQNDLLPIMTYFPENPRRWNRIISEAIVLTLRRYPYHPPEKGKEHIVPQIHANDKMAIFLIAMKNYYPNIFSFLQRRPDLFIKVYRRIIGNAPLDVGVKDAGIVNSLIGSISHIEKLEQYFIKRFPNESIEGDLNAAFRYIAENGL